MEEAPVSNSKRAHLATTVSSWLVPTGLVLIVVVAVVVVVVVVVPIVSEILPCANQNEWLDLEHALRHRSDRLPPLERADRIVDSKLVPTLLGRSVPRLVGLESH